MCSSFDKSPERGRQCGSRMCNPFRQGERWTLEYLETAVPTQAAIERPVKRMGLLRKNDSMLDVAGISYFDFLNLGRAISWMLPALRRCQ
jgi:hypothetical protein